MERENERFDFAPSGYERDVMSNIMSSHFMHHLVPIHVSRLERERERESEWCRPYVCVYICLCIRWPMEFSNHRFNMCVTFVGFILTFYAGWEWDGDGGGRDSTYINCNFCCVLCYFFCFGLFCYHFFFAICLKKEQKLRATEAKGITSHFKKVNICKYWHICSWSYLAMTIFFHLNLYTRVWETWVLRYNQLTYISLIYIYIYIYSVHITFRTFPTLRSCS